MRRCLGALVVGGAMLFPASATYADAFVIEDIEVEGLERIAAGTVFTYLPLKVGETFEDDRSADVIRALYKTGFFSDIELRRRGNVLVLIVVERPAISDITIEGNKDIGDDELKEVLKQVGISKGRVFNRSVLEKLERELRQQYFARGKYNVKIDTTIEELERNRVDIAIDISEGKAAKIRKVTIVGNEDFDEDKLLDDFNSGVPSWWAFISSRDEYSKQKLSGDLEILRSHYLDNGYIKFNLDSAQVSITPDKKDIYITINIEEGETYTLKDVKLAGNLILPEEELRSLIGFKAGDVFSRRLVTETTTRMTDRLGDEGYAFANVNPIPEVDEENKEVSLTLFVDPGSRVYVRRINFHGNYRTQDEVFRREMRQLEGGWYSTSKVNRSKVRVQRLPFIESVNVQTQRVPGAEDQIDLDITVTERQSGSFTIGAGFSQSQGLLFNLGISDDNFAGSGKRMALSLNNSNVNTIYSLSYTNPFYTLDGVSRGINISYRETDADEADVSEYSADRYGASVNYGIPLSEFNFFRTSLGYENTSLTLGSDTAQEIVNFVDDNGDDYDIFLLNAAFSHDTRNRTVFADSGNLQRLSVEASAPGSDLEYYKIGYTLNHYLPIAKKWTLSTKSTVDYGGGYGGTGGLPFFEKYYAGGTRSVRGYKDNSLGPRDSNDDPFGGDFRVVGGVELSFPVPFAPDTQSLRMSVFADAGQVYENYENFELDEIRASVGLGATWLSPVGPLTFSLAQALNDDDDDDVEVFQFNIGGGF